MKTDYPFHMSYTFQTSILLILQIQNDGTAKTKEMKTYNGVYLDQKYGHLKIL